ncbi:MAG: dockerin type I domain-containing protein [Defluviitaleaceae bacterium]|nr:dockerin type I domain-containing protein [Defluviitaleaceae bacterium]
MKGQRKFFTGVSLKKSVAFLLVLAMCATLAPLTGLVNVKAAGLGTVWYVDSSKTSGAQNGKDADDAFLTLTQLFSASGVGAPSANGAGNGRQDTVYIAAGTYQLPTNAAANSAAFSFYGSNMTFIGSGSDPSDLAGATRIWGATASYMIAANAGSALTFENILFDGMTAASGSGTHANGFNLVNNYTSYAAPNASDPYYPANRFNFINCTAQHFSTSLINLNNSKVTFDGLTVVGNVSTGIVNAARTAWNAVNSVYITGSGIVSSGAYLYAAANATDISGNGDPAKAFQFVNDSANYVYNITLTTGSGAHVFVPYLPTSASNPLPGNPATYFNTLGYQYIDASSVSFAPNVKSYAFSPTFGTSTAVHIVASTAPVAFGDVLADNGTGGLEKAYSAEPAQIGSDVGKVHVFTATANLGSNANLTFTAANTTLPLSDMEDESGNLPATIYLSVVDANGNVYAVTPFDLTAGIVYDANGAGDPVTDRAMVGSGYTILDNMFENPGYDFTGWNTSADGTGTAYAPGDVFTVPSGADPALTLFAQWKKQAPAFNPAYDLNGDGKIDSADLGILMANLNKKSTASAIAKKCDFDGDGMVTMNDYSILAAYIAAVAAAQ